MIQGDQGDLMAAMAAAPENRLRLPKRPEAATPPKPPARTSEPTSAAAADSARRADEPPAQKSPAAAKKAKPTDVASSKQQTYYLPGEIRERMRVAVAASGTTNARWLTRAFDTVSERLGEVFEPLPEMKTPGLPPEVRGPRRAVENPTPLNVRLHPATIAAMTKRRDELGVSSTSAFITEVVALALDAMGAK